MLNYQELAKELLYSEKVILKDNNGNKYKIQIFPDEIPESPRKWENVCHIFSVRGDWDIGDKGLSLPKEEAVARFRELAKRDDVLMKPVYMLDHSGQTISLTDFKDPWDSGICGWIYVFKEEAFKNYGNITEENWKDVSAKHMEGEIEIYDQYIRGEVYGFQVYECQRIMHTNIKTGAVWFTDEWEELDSCYGFYGDKFDKSGLLETAIESLPDDIEICEE